VLASFRTSNIPSFRDAHLGAGPESILTIVVMDSGLDASHRPGMTASEIPPAALNLAAAAVTYHWACCGIGAEEEA
jgi:hypothetical protein